MYVYVCARMHASPVAWRRFFSARIIAVDLRAGLWAPGAYVEAMVRWVVWSCVASILLPSGLL